MSYGPIEEGEDSVLSDILGTAFVFPPAEAAEWFERTGRENVRVLRNEGTPVAGLLHVPMGQWIGGRSVPMIGIAGVGVAIEARGANFARTLMRACVSEIAARKIALSVLYPSTQTLYRSVGYERAGKSCEYALPIQLMQPTDEGGELRVRRLGDDDLPAVKALYDAVAPDLHGALDRGPYIWSRVHNPRGRKVRGFGFFAGDELEAYAYLSQQSGDRFANYHDLWATDLIAKSARGWAAIFNLVRAQRSLAEHLEFFGAPSAPFLSLLKENRFEEKSGSDWMTRVCDVERALCDRGYPSHTRASISFEIRDDLIAANDGVWQLSVDEGRANVERGGSAQARMDIRSFAQLYMGYTPASVLARLGRIDGAAPATAALDAIFAGPIAAMVERF